MCCRLCLQFDNVTSPSSQRYNGMIDALIKTYKGEGVRGLYKVGMILYPNNSFMQNDNCSTQLVYE